MVEKRTLMLLAAQSEADFRTVARELDKPYSVRGMAGDRIRRVLMKHPIYGKAYRFPETAHEQPNRHPPRCS